MPASLRAGALVLAAGRGERLGHALPKAFVPLAGRTLLERSLRALASAGVFDVIVPVLAETDRPRAEALGLAALAGELGVEIAVPVAGGRERQDSMRAGLAALPPAIELVAVHDAARCLVAPADVAAVVHAARAGGAALLGERSRDTIKRVVGGRVVETPDRETCWAAQTPQVVRRDWLEAAVHAAAAEGRLATDDAQLVEWQGHAVEMVEARAPNPKITRPEDLAYAAALLADAGDGVGSARAGDVSEGR